MAFEQMHREYDCELDYNIFTCCKHNDGLPKGDGVQSSRNWLEHTLKKQLAKSNGFGLPQ